MNTTTQHSPSLRFDTLNWVSSAPLERDQQQSHHLHQPDHLIGTIDPITGHDIGNLQGHPSIVDGKLTVYFESEETKSEYEHMALNHPYQHSLGNPPDDADRGG